MKRRKHENKINNDGFFGLVDWMSWPFLKWYVIFRHTHASVGKNKNELGRQKSDQTKTPKK